MCRPFPRDNLHNRLSIRAEGDKLLSQRCIPAIISLMRPKRRIGDKVQEVLQVQKATPVQRKGWNVGIAIKFNGTNRPRVCRTGSVNNIDHTEVNNCPLKAIMRPHYPMRTPDDILPQISGAKYFSRLDANSGYWTFMLSHESSLFTTFNTPFGRYRYLRLPFWTEKLKGHFPAKDR